MRQVSGIWLPDDPCELDRFLEGGRTFAGKGTYQFRKFQQAFRFIDKFRHAVDIGAHVGSWSRVMARCFSKLTAFEPCVEFADCFDMNLKQEDCAIKLYRVAIGDKAKRVALVKDDALTHVAEGSGVSMMPLDAYNLQDVDMIKIDVEGFEEHVLKGGEATIRNNKPLLIIEQKPGLGERYGSKKNAAIKLAHRWGARVRLEMDDDYCMMWKQR